jgi:2-hydroxy-3-keto-5-methylthiopentenyl-1-phosphate phosphatase
MRGRTIVVDFDGTITEEDLLDAVAERFGDSAVYQHADAGLDAGRMSLHDVIRREFEPVRAPLDEVVAWVLENARIRPGFHELVDAAKRNGWRLVILSSGFRELIEPILEREGLGDVELLANEVNADPSGWRVRFRDEEPCTVCGEPCKRSTVAGLAGDDEVVYIGDGHSDRCAADDADVVFARRGLASWLGERGRPYESFEDFHSIVRTLDRAAA